MEYAKDDDDDGLAWSLSLLGWVCNSDLEVFTTV